MWSLLAALWLTATPEVRYLALGDSFTIGTGSPVDRAFPERAAARWRATCDVTVLNPARNGFTTQDLIDRELPLVAGFRPTIVTLAIGANDIVRGASTAAYRAQVERIFDRLAADGVPAARVVTLPQPAWWRSPVAAAFGEPEAIAAKIDAFNAVLREVSARRGARYLDLGARMDAQAKQGMVAPDGLHPSAEALDAWAAALAAQVPCGG